MAEETIVRTVDIRTKKSEQALGSLDKTTAKVTKSTGGLEQQLNAVPGPLGKAKQGVGALSKAFKALLANPIVALIAAIVAALVGLVKAFQKTEAGADKLNDMMAALSAAMDVIVARAAQIFKALGKIFTGRFKEGFEDMGNAVKGVGDEIREATAAAVEFEKMQRRLFEGETDIITVNAERRRQIQELIFLTRDLTVSVEERRDAIIQADAIERQILADNIKLQEQRVAIARQDIANTPEELRTREQRRKLAEEEAKLIDLQTNSLAKQRELKNRLNELENKARADAKAAAAEAAKEEADRLAALEEERKLKAEARKEEMELDLLLEEEFQKSMLELDKGFAEQSREIEEQNNEAFKKSAEERFAYEEQLIQQQIENEQMLASVKQGIYANTVTALLGFLGEGSRIAKAVQVADATRTAIITAMQAYKSAVGIPVVGSVLGPIAAAAALAAGMANVRKIIQTPDPTGAASPPTPSVSLARPQGNVSTADLVNAEQGIPQEVNVIQDSTTRGRDQAGTGAMKTYVVSSEVTAEQEIDRKREEDVTI
jgi:hypothetical protein